MALQLRTIFGTILGDDGNPIEGINVYTELLDIAILGTGEIVVPSREPSGTTDASGYFSFQVWANEQGGSIGYKVFLPRGFDYVKFPNSISVPPGSSPISLSALATAASIAPNQTASAIAQLEDYVDEKIALASLGGGGGGTVNGSSIGFTPVGDVQSTTLQAAIAEIDAEKLSTAYSLPVDPVLLLENSLL